MAETMYSSMILNLPIFNKNSSSTPGRAQNFSVLRLNQQKDRDKAKVSIDELTHPTSKATTSISHPGGQGDDPVTSVAHIGEKDAENLADEMYSKDADEKRYEYIRRLVMERKAKERAEEAKEIGQKVARAKSAVENSSIFGKLRLKTGSGFRTNSLMGLKRQFYRLRKQNPLAYKNISNKDQKYYLDMVKKYAKAVGVGKGFDHQARRHMRNKIELDRRASRISNADAEDFRKMIDELPFH